MYAPVANVCCSARCRHSTGQLVHMDVQNRSRLAMSLRSGTSPSRQHVVVQVAATTRLVRPFSSAGIARRQVVAMSDTAASSRSGRPTRPVSSRSASPQRWRGHRQSRAPRSRHGGTTIPRAPKLGRVVRVGRRDGHAVPVRHGCVLRPVQHPGRVVSHQYMAPSFAPSRISQSFVWPLLPSTVQPGYMSPTFTVTVDARHVNQHDRHVDAVARRPSP